MRTMSIHRKNNDKLALFTSWACSNQAGDMVTIPGFDPAQSVFGLKNTCEERQDPVDDPPLKRG
jgi:hypothetical protein